MLAQDGHPTPLGQAFAEYGRIAKTLHLLALVNPADDGCPRTVNTQLTVQESRHRLARKIFHGHRGELRQAYRHRPGVRQEGREAIRAASAAFSGRFKASVLNDEPQSIRFADPDATIVISRSSITLPGQSERPGERRRNAACVLACQDDHLVGRRLHQSPDRVTPALSDKPGAPRTGLPSAVITSKDTSSSRKRPAGGWPRCASDAG